MTWVPPRLQVWLSILSLADPEGGMRWGPLLKNHKNIGFLSNAGPDPLKNHKATKPAFHSMLAHHRAANKTPLKWRFVGRVDDGPFLVVSGSPHLKKPKTNKTFSKLNPLSPRMLLFIFKLYFSRCINLVSTTLLTDIIYIMFVRALFCITRN